jgi:hypothetical protein
MTATENADEVFARLMAKQAELDRMRKAIQELQSLEDADDGIEEAAAPAVAEEPDDDEEQQAMIATLLAKRDELQRMQQMIASLQAMETAPAEEEAEEEEEEEEEAVDDSEVSARPLPAAFGPAHASPPPRPAAPACSAPIAHRACPLPLSLPLRTRTDGGDGPLTSREAARADAHARGD